MTPIAPTTPPTMAPVLDEDEDVDGLTEAGMVVNVDTSLVTMTVEPTAFVELVGRINECKEENRRRLT